LALGSVVSGPVLWLVVVYLGSLALLITSAFFRLDDFTGKSTSEWTLANLDEAFTTGAYRTLVVRSVLIAAAATASLAWLARGPSADSSSHSRSPSGPAIS